MGHLTNVARRGDTAKADTEAQDEASTEEMASVGRCSLDAGTDDDDCTVSDIGIESLAVYIKVLIRFFQRMLQKIIVHTFQLHFATQFYHMIVDS